MTTIAANGIQLYFERQGEGPPLLLIAGVASDSASWGPVIEPLAERFDVISIDNRCTGRTEPSPCEVGLDLMVADCLAVLDALDLPAAQVIGHSLGGIVGLHLASRHPDRVTSLVAAATAPTIAPMHLSLFGDLARIYETEGVPVTLWFRLLFPWLFARRFFANLAAIEAAAEMARDYPYRQSAAAFRGQVAALADFMEPPDLAAISCPVLALHADRDLLVQPKDLAGFEPIPNLTTATVADAGHSIHWDQPDAFMEQITRFHRALK